MKVIPAIDLLGGQVVRLTRGRQAEKIVYPISPLEAAKKWISQGVDLLHIVDLDSALSTGRNNIDIIKQLLDLGVSLQVGGGIRDFNKASLLVSMGVERIIVSTKVFEDESFLDQLVKAFADKVCVSVDAKGDMLLLKGWQDLSNWKVSRAFKFLEEKGVKWVVYTDINRDGTLEGIDPAKIKPAILGFNLNFIISGGVSSLRDIESLINLGIWGVITGKAIYEGSLSLRDAVALTSSKKGEDYTRRG